MSEQSTETFIWEPGSTETQVGSTNQVYDPSGVAGPVGPQGSPGPPGNLGDVGFELMAGDSFTTHDNRYLPSNPQTFAAKAPSGNQYNSIAAGNKGMYVIDGRGVRATHRIELSNNPVAGTYQLSYQGIVTDPIPLGVQGRDIQVENEIQGMYDWIVGGAPIAGGNSIYGLCPSTRRDPDAPERRWHPDTLPVVVNNTLTNALGQPCPVDILPDFGLNGPCFAYYPCGMIPDVVSGRFCFVPEGDGSDNGINIVLGLCLNSFGESSIQGQISPDRSFPFWTQTMPGGDPPTAINEQPEFFFPGRLRVDGYTEYKFTFYRDRATSSVRMFLNGEQVGPTWTDPIINLYWNHTVGVQIRKPGLNSNDAEWIEWTAGSAVDLMPQVKYWRVEALSEVNVAGMPNPGLPTCDGVVPKSGDVIMLPNQTNEIERGLWVASGSIPWTRHPATPDGLLFRTRIAQVARGSRAAGTTWQCGATGGVTTGVDPQLWERRDALILTRTVNGGNGQDLDLRMYNTFILTATTDNAVLNFINAPSKGGRRTIYLKQSVGNQTWTLPPDMYPVGGIPYSPTLRAGAMDRINLDILPDGTKVYDFELDIKKALGLQQKAVNNTLVGGANEQVMTTFTDPPAATSLVVAVWAPRTPFANTLAPPTGWTVIGPSDRGATLSTILLQWTGPGAPPQSLTLHTNGLAVNQFLDLLEFNPQLAGGNVLDGVYHPTDGGAATRTDLPLIPADAAGGQEVVIAAVSVGVNPNSGFTWTNGFIAIPGLTTSDRLGVAYKITTVGGSYGTTPSWTSPALASGLTGAFK